MLVAQQTDAVLYRGFHGEGHDHSATRLGTPTYTDSAQVAAVYGTNPTHRDVIARLPRMAIVQIKSQATYQMGDLEIEDVVTWKQLRATLNLSEAERDVLLKLDWRADGAWITVTPGQWPNEETYTDTYLVANCPEFMEMLRRRGYDMLIMRGTFGHHLLHQFNHLPQGSYRDDDYSVLEWRPLTPSIVEELATFPIDDHLLERITPWKQ